MTKRYNANKFSDRISLRKGRKLFEELINKYGIEGTCFSDRMLALGEHLLSHNGVENLETALEEDNYFNCNKLCKKARQCTSQAMNDLEEIKATNCYVSRYPYKWTTPDGRTVRGCKFMVFANGFPHDEENPYPKCIHPKPPIYLPKDRIIKDPQICWICYKQQKKAREEKVVKNALRDDYRKTPRVNWGKSEGLPSWYDLY